MKRVKNMISQKLEMLRVGQGLTKKAIAADLGIHESTYGKYELGHREPDLEMIAKLAAIFNCSTDYLLGRSGTPNEKKAIPDEITFDDFDYALYGEVRELTEEDKAEILKNAQRLNELRKLKEAAKRGGKDG